MTEPLEAAQSPLESIGAQLKKERENQGYSVNQVAELMRVAAVTVNAIEAADESKLPKPLFVKGYVKGYCKVLHLPENHFADLLAKAFPEQKIAPAVPLSSDGRPFKREVFETTGSNWISKIAMAVLALVLLAAVAYFSGWLSSSSEENDDTTTRSNSPISTTEIIQEPLLVDETNTEPLVDANDISNEQDSVAGLADEATVALETEEGDLSSQSVGEPTIEPEPASSIINEATDTASEENSPPPSVRVKEVGSGQYTLALDFSDSCWIEVVDLDGNVIDADLYSPSRRLVVQFDEPIEVLLGYAPAVTATLNEEPLTFRIPPSEIVRLTLPQGDL